MSARTTLPLLWPAVEQRGQRDRPAQGEGTDALGAAELVAADADQVSAGAELGDIEPWDGLNSVSVHYSPGGTPPDQTGDLGHGLDRPYLAVDQLDRHDGHGLVEGGGQGAQVDDAVVPHSDHPDRHPYRTLCRPGGVEHGVVLYGAHHYRPRCRLRPSEYGEVVRFGAIGREDHIPGSGAEDAGHLVTAPRRRPGAPHGLPNGSRRGCRTDRTARAAWPRTPPGKEAWWRHGPGTPACPAS